MDGSNAKIRPGQLESNFERLLAAIESVHARLENIEKQIAHSTRPKGDRLTVKEAAKHLRISTRKLEDVIAKGELVPVRPGGARGKRFFTRQALDAHLKRSADR